VSRGEIRISIGFGFGGIPEESIFACADGRMSRFTVKGVGMVEALAVPIDDAAIGTLVLGRSDDPFSREEEALLRAMGRVLAMACRMLRMLDNERALREKSEAQTSEIEKLLASLVERQQLLERLSKIQASISHRKPLQEVLDSISQGAVELLNSEVVALRLVDPDDPDFMITLSTAGVSEDEMRSTWRIQVGEGAGGRAISEDRLVVMEHYDEDPTGLSTFKDSHLQTAMAAPVHEHGQAIGSLVVASYRKGRRYSEEEKAALIAFAEHASLALSDAKNVEVMREAQRSKDMFLAMVSHELKTPLTVIMGTLRTLERFIDSLDPEERHSMLSAAYERGKDLKRLIDRLLQGASAELAEADNEVYLPDLIAEAVRGFEHSFRLKVGAIPQETLELNAASIHRLIGILIENALSHSPSSSSIWVGADLVRDGITFWVENQGELPEGSREELFQPFHRGSEATSSGVGLGLYIARRIAESMNGALDVSSGGGRVRFFFRVPLRKSSFPRLPSSPPIPAEVAQQG
jgi:signal transduction histidine kinase